MMGLLPLTSSQGQGAILAMVLGGAVGASGSSSYGSVCISLGFLLVRLGRVGVTHWIMALSFQTGVSIAGGKVSMFSGSMVHCTFGVPW